MAEWQARVFWREVTVAPAPGGHAVHLDGRPVRTPNRAPLTLPSRPLADLVAGEWAAQAGVIRPELMPATRLANSAIEKVRPARDAVVALLAGYGETDLLCYRAEGPPGLCALQAQGWDPLVDWAAALGIGLRTGTGVMPIAQPGAALDRLTDEVAAMDDFRLAAFHELVTLSGSAIIALAVVHGVRDPETAWTLSRIDEDWQAAAWGRDAEAESVAEARRQGFLFAARFHALA
ncbi:MAG: ATPase [Rubellimicrobium sp.]|nr:ATPase [Rubellimicrobium sp.]